MMSIEALKSRFFQCRFLSVIEEIETRGEGVVGEAFCHLGLIKFKALTELRRDTAAKSLLQELLKSPDVHAELHLNVIANLWYHDRNYQEAERLFKIQLEYSASVKDHFDASLGLAKVFAKTKRYEQLASLICEMDEIKDLVAPDARLSFGLVRAAACFVASNQPDDAKAQFFANIKEAHHSGWTYFHIKSLFGLAIIARERRRLEELDSLLQVLDTYLSPCETLRLNDRVIQEFTVASPAQPAKLSFDAEYKRMGLFGRWIPLHDKPLIFRFVEVLHRSHAFVQKHQLATALWNEEVYRPRVHDPRIFDLARRVRAMFDSFDNKPMSLLSGRHGYKLAMTGTGTADPLALNELATSDDCHPSLRSG